MAHSGIADWSPFQSFWVWATFGPSLNGLGDGLFFKDGIHPHPLPGPLAESFQLRGNYMTTPYDPAFEFSHWDGVGYRRVARFAKPVDQTDSDDLPSPPLVLPGQLSKEWVDFFAKYTYSGRLKKAHRGD